MDADGRGRGQLHSIQRLPDEADSLVRCAVRELGENKLTQQEIRIKLNAGLEKLGIQPISSSSFNRYSMRLSISGKKLMRQREAIAAYVREVGERPDTKIGLLISEFGKSLIYDLIESAHAGENELSPKDLAQIALSYQRFSHGDHKLLQAADQEVDLDAKLSAKEAAKVIDSAARHAGVSENVREQIKREILGIDEP